MSETRRLEIKQLEIAIARTETLLIKAQQEIYRLADKKANQKAELLLQKILDKKDK